MNQYDSDIGYRFVIACRYKFAVKLRIVMAASEFAHLNDLNGIVRPLPQPAGTQIVFVIDKQFLQTRLCDIKQFYVRFRLCRRYSTSLDDILLGRARSLHHLVYRAVALLQKTIAKIERNIIY